MKKSSAISVVVLISGNGSNLQAIIDTLHNQGMPIIVRAVISNIPGAYGLQRAQKAGIPTQVLSHTHFTDREAFDQALQHLIDGYQPQLVVLAGFMRILSKSFVEHYEGRMMNIHPSLLPKFRGLNTHDRVLQAGETQHGATVHFVSHELDGGPAVIQATAPVYPNDTKEALGERVLQLEHEIFPLAIRWFAEGRLQYANGKATMDGKVLEHPLQYPLQQM